jgi:hypothetical protein
VFVFEIDIIIRKTSICKAEGRTHLLSKLEHVPLKASLANLK